jgi:LAO/AO transport system kinase
MDALVDDVRAYVRSIASRGGPEGLAYNITDLVALVDAYGFDELLLETVGVGQAECAVRTLVDTLILILHPEAGDSIQAMKSGILELADVYIVNKADLPGAARTASELRAVLRAAPTSSAWSPPVIEVSQGDESSIELVNQVIEAHRSYIQSSRDNSATQLMRRKFRLQSLLQRRIDEVLGSNPRLLTSSDPAASFREALSLLLGEIA